MEIEDPDEKKLYCRDCNAYLWSVSIYETGPDILPCPCRKDCLGKCTGIMKGKR